MQRYAALVVTVLSLLASFPSPGAAQGTPMPFVVPTFVDNNNAPCSGCLLNAYAAGSTTTRQATYKVIGLTVGQENANPIVLDSAGRPTSGYIFLSPTTYRFVLTDSTGATTYWDADNTPAIPSTAVALDVPSQTAGEALSVGDVVYLSDGSGALTAGRWYKADADFTYASTTPWVGIVPTAIASAATGSIRIGGRVTALSALTAGTVYYASATAGALTSSAPTNARRIGQADTTTSIVIDPNPPATLTTPGGSDTYVQFNDSSAFGGDSGLLYNKTTDALTVVGDVSVGGGDIIATADAIVRRSTSDASDNGTLSLTGGGATGTARGGELFLYGNENGTPGAIIGKIGNVASAKFAVNRADGTESFNVLGTDGSTTSTTSNAAAGWVFNSTATDGAYLEIRRSGTAKTYLGNPEALNASWGTNNDTVLYANGELIVSGNTMVRPASSDGNSLGNTTYHWSAVWASNGTIQTSDRRRKIDEGSALGLDFINALRPRAYHWIKDDGHLHYGLYAQDVLALAPPTAFVWGNDADGYALNYAEFTAPLVMSVQELTARVAKQLDLIAGFEVRLRALEAENAALKGAAVVH